jgi:hypothetical protein
LLNATNTMVCSSQHSGRWRWNRQASRPSSSSCGSAAALPGSSQAGPL